MSNSVSLGDQIYQNLATAKAILFKSGELHQFALEAFHYVINNFGKGMTEDLDFKFPVGRRKDGAPIYGQAKHNRESFEKHNRLLAETALPVQSIYGLVSTIENMFSSVIRTLCVRYPGKIGDKKMVPMDAILRCKTVEEIYGMAIDSLLYDLSYKSPKDFAKSAESLLGINLLEIPQFHRYIELKATRDIYVHNMGICNEIYLTKADSDPPPLWLTHG